MLLRILPDTKVPSVLFTLTFPHLPLDLPCPPSWNAYLQRLAVEELELPRDLHSLDKAAWISTILAEVTFDMTRGVVRALFIDDTVQEWPLMDKTCLITLDGILKDVNLSTMDFSAPKEKAVEKPIESRPPTPSKSVKHKKQRSLLASLVALVSLPSSSSSSRCSSPPPSESPASSIRPLPPSAPCSRPSTPAPMVDPMLSQRILRRRARIALMDAYRRFIVSELKERLHPSGYSAWIVNSMLRRASDHMSALVDQAGGAVPDLRQFLPFPMDEIEPMGMYHEDPQQFESQTQVDESALFDCDEEDGDGRSLSTDTDGSSIHTPLHTPTSWRQNSISSWSARSDADAEFTTSSSSAPPRSPSPPAFTQQDIETYVGLTRQSLHLRRLLVHMDVMQKAVESDTKQLLTVLEIKSKRRAWSNRQFCGGAGMKDLGLGQPFRSSPLVLYEPIGAAGMTNSQIVRANKERRYPSAVELFPRMSLSPSPSNEDYDGSSVTSSPKEGGRTLEVPHPRIRLRTKSIEHLKVLDQELENDMKDSRMPSPPPLPLSPPSPSRSPIQSLPSAADAAASHGHGLPPSLPLVAAPVPQKPERHMLFEPDFGMGSGKARGEMLEMPLGSMIEALDDIERDLEAGLAHGQRRYERDEWLPGIVVGER